MLPNLRIIGGSQIREELFRDHQGIHARHPHKYSEDDWLFNNKVKFGFTLDQQRRAQRVVELSRSVVDKAKESTKKNQQEVEHHMRERVSEIKFLCDELNKQKKTAMLEEEALDTFRSRVLNAIEFLKEKSLAVCQRCFVLRDDRIGVDLCDDEVDRQLRREMKVIKGCQALMDRTLIETEDRLRTLRAALYLLDKDLEQKDISLRIDEKNLLLTESLVEKQPASRDLSEVNCRFTIGEWEQQTYKNLETNAKALNAAAELRAYIDLLLKQVCEDMKNQTERTNEAFVRRIAEIEQVKRQLEIKHSDTSNQANTVQRNLEILAKELQDKSGSLALCQVRLTNRALRPGLEMTCDMVQDTLYLELNALKAVVCQLKQQIEQNKATLRYLLHVQLMQAEEINVKVNSIKIDEVECMTIRQVLKYQTF